MATVKRFEDLGVWQEARRLSNQINLIVNKTELKNDFRLRDQIRASVGSVMDNIAEGFERNGNTEFRQFLSIAKGSAGEARSQLYRLFDYGYITETELATLKTDFENLSGRLNKFITYLNNKDYKGTKFQ